MGKRMCIIISFLIASTPTIIMIIPYLISLFIVIPSYLMFLYPSLCSYICNSFLLFLPLYVSLFVSCMIFGYFLMLLFLSILSLRLLYEMCCINKLEIIRINEISSETEFIMLLYPVLFFVLYIFLFFVFSSPSSLTLIPYLLNLLFL